MENKLCMECHRWLSQMLKANCHLIADKLMQQFKFSSMKGGKSIVQFHYKHFPLAPRLCDIAYSIYC